MRIFWVNSLIKQAGDGAGLGFSIHEAQTRKRLEALGVEISDRQKNPCDWALAIRGTGAYRPIPHRRNALFTMTETRPVFQWSPDNYGANLLIVPSEYSRSVLSEMYCGPIEIVPEGVDSSVFTLQDRRRPQESEPFTFLFVGSTIDERKGCQLLISAFRHWIDSGRAPKNVRLYVKATERTPADSVVQERGIVYDARRLPTSELVKLYHDASAFIFPSSGEGWGLTLCEALATGIPAAWSDNSAPHDYLDERDGLPLKNLVPHCLGSVYAYGSRPTEAVIIEAAEELYHNYEKYITKGRHASEKMRSVYTWDRAGERLLQVLEEHGDDAPMTPAERCPEWFKEKYRAHTGRDLFPPQYSAKKIKRMIARSA